MPIKNEWTMPTNLVSLAEQISNTLRASLITGRMKPGKTYSVPSIAKEFGVSVTPVREAMLNLIKEGLVVPIKNKGFRIAKISSEDLDQIVEVRQLIEVPVVLQVMTSISEAKLRELHAIAERVVSYAEMGDVILYIETDRTFHLDMIAVTGNMRIVRIVDELRAQTRLYGLGKLAREGSLVDSAREHLEILAAMEQKDADKVSQLMKRHIAHGRGIWANIEEPES